MKSVLILLFAVLLCSISYAQGDSFANPMNVDAACYPEMTDNLVLPFGSYNIPVGNDFYISFTAEQKAVKILVVGSVPAGLNSNIELRNDVDATIASVAGNTLWYTSLIAGQTYYIRISDVENDFGGDFTIQLEEIEDAKIKDSYVPSLSLFDSMDGHFGYRVSNNLRRTEGCNYVADASKWCLYDSGNTFLAEYTILGGTSNFNLENFSDFICFGNSYSIQVEIQVEGNWLGTSPAQTIMMEDEPFADINLVTTEYSIDNNDFISCENIGSGNTMEWEFISQDNESIFNVSQTSTFLYLNTIDCLLDNSIYSVKVRSTYCGDVGPWTDVYTITTTPMPTSNIDAWINSSITEYEPLSCPATVPYNSSIRTTGYTRADQYVWQFTPIIQGDPTMTPIGLPIVINAGATFALSLQSIPELEIGTSYRVGVKWAHGLDGGCVVQESDYGTFCEVTIEPPFQGINPSIGLVSSNSYNLSSALSSAKPIQNQDLNKSLNENKLFSVLIYDLTGRIVYQDNSEIHSVENIAYLKNLSLRGNYIVVYKNSTKQTVVHRFFN